MSARADDQFDLSDSSAEEGWSGEDDGDWEEGEESEQAEDGAAGAPSSAAAAEDESESESESTMSIDVELPSWAMIDGAAHAARKMQRIYRGRRARAASEQKAMATVLRDPPGAIRYGADGMANLRLRVRSEATKAGVAVILEASQPALLARVVVDAPTARPMSVFLSLHVP